MNLKFLLSTFLFINISCNDDNDSINVPIDNEKLLGNWILIESYISPGGAAEWQNVEKGFRYIFEDKGLFQKRNFDNSLDYKGNFQVNEDELFFYFKNEKVSDTLGYKIELDNAILTISPFYPTMCIEGCLYRFKKE